MSDWHTSQDKLIDEGILALSKIHNHESAVRRMWAYTDNFIAEKHLINILSSIKQDDDVSIIDVGCGSGYLLSRISLLFPKARLFGIDSNAVSIEIASRRVPNGKFQVGTFDDAQGSYDVVICSEVFEHVIDTKALLRKLSTLANDKGILSFSTPSGWMWRLPRLSVLYQILKFPKRFWRIYLHPEDNWEQALAIHPAIMPSKAIKMLNTAGFSVIKRQSCLWLLNESGPLYKYYARLESKCAQVAAIEMYNLISFLEAALNVIPILRIFESRFIILAKRTHDSA